MTSAEHYAEAERLLHRAADAAKWSDNTVAIQLAQRAQVHATLALANPGVVELDEPHVYTPLHTVPGR